MLKLKQPHPPCPPSKCFKENMKMQAIQTFEDQLGAQFSVNCWALKFSSGPILAAELSDNVQLSLPTHWGPLKVTECFLYSRKKRLSKACAYAKRPPKFFFLVLNHHLHIRHTELTRSHLIKFYSTSKSNTKILP